MITVAQLTDLLEPYSYCPLECDGLTRVFATLLQEQGIVHTVYSGMIRHRMSGEGIVHMWIEVYTDEGRRAIDYCARMWLGSGVEVPHGIFNPMRYPDITYQGEQTELAALSEEGLALVGYPVTGLINALQFLPRPLVFTMGYRQPHAHAILAFLTSRGFPVADIRERAGSRFSPMYNRGRLELNYPGQYYRIKELGNVNHNIEGAPVEFVDLEAGLAKSERIIYEGAAGQGAIYMCACQYWQTCHRANAARHLLDTLPEVTIAHVQANGSIIVKRKNSRSELLMISKEPIGPHGMFRVIYDNGQIASTYNPAIVESLLRDAETHPACVQMQQCYCEVPVHDYIRSNLHRQGYLVTPSTDTTIAETTVSASEKE